MTCEIYSYGGGKVLWEIFNVVSLMFQDNAYALEVSKLTATISLILVALRTVNKGNIGFLFKDWFFPAIAIINLLVVPKVSVDIIDPVDQNFRYSRVDNIPVGLAQTASFVSTLSHHLTEVVERHLCKTPAKFSTTGPLFGARLANLAREVRLKDPITRENVKNYVRQCFMWPYVFGNISPGKKAALESENILEFIKANPHPGLGIYWREPDGSSEFKPCSACTGLVEAAMVVERDGAEKSIAAKLFGTSQVSAQAQTQLKKYFSDGWEQISKKTAQAANIVQQNLMINAFREALDDKREEFGLGRIDPTLISLNAGRSQAQQNNTFLVKGALAGQTMPMMHSVVFAALILAFVFVIPLTLLTNGTKMLLTWFKMMIAASLWPVIFAVFDGMGSIYASAAVASTMIGTSGGLTLLTQSGMADAAFDAYCWVMSMQMSIPIIAWAFVSGGGYAISQLSSSFTSGVEAGASKAGNEMVDGNVSFDAQTLHHRSVANTQVAQQSLGAMTSWGMRMDDGKMSILHGAGGKVTAQEHLPNLATNMSQNDTASLAFSLQGQMAYNTALTKSQMASTTLQDTVSNMYSLANSASQGLSFTEGAGTTKSAQAQQAFNKAMDSAKQVQKLLNVDEGTAFNLLANAAIGKSAGSGSGSWWSLFSGGLSAGASANASQLNQLSETDRNSFVKTFTESMNEGMNFMKDEKSSLTDSTQKNLTDSIQKGITTTNQHSDQAQASYAESQSFTKLSSAARNESTAMTTNKTDMVTDHVASTRFNGNKVAALQWGAENPDLYARVGRNIMHNQEQSYTRSAANMGVSFSQEGVKKADDTYQNQVVSNVDRDAYNKAKAENESKQGILTETKLKEKMGVLDNFVTGQIEEIGGMRVHKNDVASQMDLKEALMKTEKEKSSAARATKAAAGAAADTGAAIGNILFPSVNIPSMYDKKKENKAPQK